MASTLDPPRSRIWYVFTALLPYLTLVIIFGTMFVRDRYLPQATFFTRYNLSGLATDCAPTIVAAAGMTVVMLAGGIDLSVGSIIGVSSAIASYSATRFQSASLGICAGMAAGMLCGLFNGTLVTLLKVQPFIVTLGSLLSLRGVCYLLNGNGTTNASIFVGEGLEKSEALKLAANFKWISGNMPYVELTRFVPLVAAVVFVLWVVLNHMRLGRRIYAVGSNEEAARLSGVRIARTKIAAYAIGGLAAGIAGVMNASRIGGSFTNTGSGEELTVIAAVVIGGTSLSGGQGAISGCVIGAILMKALSSACTFLHVEEAWQKVIIGLFLIGAAALDRLRREKAE